MAGGIAGSPLLPVPGTSQPLERDSGSRWGDPSPIVSSYTSGGLTALPRTWGGHVAQAWPIGTLHTFPPHTHTHSDWLKDEHVAQVHPMSFNLRTTH